MCGASSNAAAAAQQRQRQRALCGGRWHARAGLITIRAAGHYRRHPVRPVRTNQQVGGRSEQVGGSKQQQSRQRREGSRTAAEHHGVPTGARGAARDAGQMLRQRTAAAAAAAAAAGQGRAYTTPLLLLSFLCGDSGGASKTVVMMRFLLTSKFMCCGWRWCTLRPPCYTLEGRVKAPDSGRARAQRPHLAQALYMRPAGCAAGGS